MLQTDLPGGASYWFAGERLHLQHGPINLVISMETSDADCRKLAERTAMGRFATVLQEVVAELACLKSPSGPHMASPRGSIPRRMHSATEIFSGQFFVTPMAAVAGAVADEMLSSVLGRISVDKILVNNGGDIALHLRGDKQCGISVRSLQNKELARIRLRADDSVGGTATSGRGGKSLSFGIADSVTALAGCAAQADVAATLIANAVDLPGHPAIRRKAACEIDESSDLGNRKVVVGCGHLREDEVRSALEKGCIVAHEMMVAGNIRAAALFLRNRRAVVLADDLDSDRVFRFSDRESTSMKPAGLRTRSLERSFGR